MPREFGNAARREPAPKRNEDVDSQVWRKDDVDEDDVVIPLTTHKLTERKPVVELKNPKNIPILLTDKEPQTEPSAATRRARAIKRLQELGEELKDDQAEAIRRAINTPLDEN